MPLLAWRCDGHRMSDVAGAGYRFQKFFPAEPAGGVAYLSSLSQPLPQVSFCPTGGITPADRHPAYLKLCNVITVGGSWMVPKKLIEAGDWAGIEKLAARGGRPQVG